jgi:hypothetical protein
MSGDVRLEIVVGTGSPPAITLRAGEKREPFTAGFEGTWSLAGAGVARIHANFYFDGATLYVASADARTPALLEGEAVPADWTRVPIPSTLSLGSIVVSAIAASLPDSFNDKTEPRAQMHSAPPSERTRYAPVENLPPARPPMPSRAPAPAPSLAPAFAPAPPPAPAPAPPRAPSRIPAFWSEASLPKKLTYVLLPFGLLAAAYVVLDDDAPKQAARGKPAPSASASVAAIAPSAPLPSSTAMSMDDAPPTPASPSSASALPPGAKRQTDPRAKRTTDRQVVDLIAAGAYADAAKMLEQLAAAQPDKAEYKDALRVVKAKAREGGQ